MPVKAGRKRLSKTPTIERRSNDAALLRYNCLSQTQFTDGAGTCINVRPYIPGFLSATSSGAALLPSAGVSVVNYYSTARFLPGTRIKWCPNVSFNTAGRVYVGFSDNPEVCSVINGYAGSYATGGVSAAALSFINAVCGLGDVVSFPVWEETQVTFPTRTRKKMFDTNFNAAITDVNILDRAQQTCMYAALVGVLPSSGVVSGLSIGNFEYHDVVEVEGLTNVQT